MPEQVVVVGASGFIGKALMDALAAAGIPACGFSRKDCDFLERDEVVEVIGPKLGDAILVYAAGKHRQYGDTLDYYDMNSAAVLNMLHAAEENPPRQIILLSSIEVYGSIDQGTQVTLATPLAPSNLYAAGKIAQEFLLRAWGPRNKVPCSMLRLPGIYGVADMQTSIISILFDKAKHGVPFDLYTAGNELRDYVSATELGACIAQLVVREVLPEIINIGSGASVSLNRIIGLVGQISGKSLVVNHRSPPLASFDIVIDDGPLREILADWPFSSLEDGIGHYADQRVA